MRLAIRKKKRDSGITIDSPVGSVILWTSPSRNESVMNRSFSNPRNRDNSHEAAKLPYVKHCEIER